MINSLSGNHAYLQRLSTTLLIVLYGLYIFCLVVVSFTHGSSWSICR